MEPATHSLAEIAPDEVVTVSRILFECLESHCAELGVREGARLSVVGERPVSVVGGDTPAMLFRTPEGQLVRCPPELARFIEVHREVGA